LALSHFSFWASNPVCKKKGFWLQKLAISVAGFFGDSFVASAVILSSAARKDSMRPKKHERTSSGDLFRARLDQIIVMKHELVRLADKIDWDWLDGELANLFSDKGRPETETRFMIGLLVLKHIYGLSDEEVCALGL
jgi:hypothetical protein